MPKEPTDHRQINTDGGTYIEGNVHADGDVVLGDKYVYTQSDVEQLDAYLKTAVTTLEARIQRLVYRPDPPTEPYKFLDAFEIQDHPIFFGREDASDQLFSKVTAHRLTVLHAKSGAGKSSLLQAGLGPRLVRSGRLPVYTRAYRDPVEAIKRAVAPPSHGQWPALLSTLTLHEFLGMACKQLNSMDELVVMLDQFEAFFVLGPTGEHQRPFIDALADCVEDSSLHVRFVVALRKEYFPDLHVFQVRLPQIFHHEMALGAMMRSEAESAITGPIAKLGRSVTYEEALLDILLADLTRGEVELPHLQIICAQLYEGLRAEETIISLAAYEALDRAAGVLGGYLQRVLMQLHEADRKIAQSALVSLVSSEGTKRVLHHKVLAEQVKVTDGKLNRVLARLVNGRLLQRDEVDSVLVYEIAHESLAPEIQKWINWETLAVKQAEELLAREVANWRVHGTLIPKERLALIYPHRKSLPIHSEEVRECLAHSVVRSGHQVKEWIQQLGDTAESTLLALLKDPDSKTKGNALKGLGTLWKLNAVSKLGATKFSARQGAAEALGRLGDVRAIEPLISVLNDANAGVRQAAVEALSRLEKSAVEPLTTRLNDDDSHVRQGAVAALGKLGEPAIEPLIARLDNSDPKVRQGAAEALGSLGNAWAVKPLIELLTDKCPAVRREAAEALGRLGDARAVEPLITGLNDDDNHVRQGVVEALGKLGDGRAIEPLIAQLDDDWNMRRSAVDALGTLGELVIEPLITRLSNDDNHVQQGAVDALGKVGEPAIEPLIARLNDDDNHVQQGAIDALGKVGELAVKPLIARLTDDDYQVRRGVVEILGKLGDDRAVEPLIARLNDANPEVRQGVVVALRRLGDTRAVEPLIAQLHDGVSEVERRTAEALGMLRDTRAVAPLIDQLDDANVEVRQTAAEALGRLGDARAIKPLIARLNDTDYRMRREVAAAVSRLGKLAVKPLIDQLNNDNSHVRQGAAEALGRLGDKRAVKPLIARLNDASPAVRRWVVKSLGRLGDKRAVKPLIARLNDASPVVRRWVVEAIERIGEPAVKPLIVCLNNADLGVQKRSAGALQRIGTPDALAAVERYKSRI